MIAIRPLARPPASQSRPPERLQRPARSWPGRLAPPFAVPANQKDAQSHALRAASSRRRCAVTAARRTAARAVHRTPRATLHARHCSGAKHRRPHASASRPQRRPACHLQAAGSRRHRGVVPGGGARRGGAAAGARAGRGAGAHPLRRHQRRVSLHITNQMLLCFVVLGSVTLCWCAYVLPQRVRG